VVPGGARPDLNEIRDHVEGVLYNFRDDVSKRN